MKSIVSVFLIQSLFFPLVLSSTPNIGLYFSPILTTENGFFILGIEISKAKTGLLFFAQELRFHREKGWEEILYQGNAVPNDKEENLVLKPNSCQVRANISFGEKKGLVRRFDCTHLDFEIRKAQSTFFLSESLFGTVKQVPLPVWLPQISDEPVAISFLLPGAEKEEGVWGFHLNGIGKKNPYQIWDESQTNWATFRSFVPITGPSTYHIYRWKRTFSD